MISQDERMRLAESICARMVSKYPDDVIVGGIYGSTAMGMSTPWSDLELLCVVKAGSRIQKNKFIYRHIAVSVSVIEQGDLEQTLTSSPLKWRYYMNVLSHLKILHGQPKQLDAWLELGQLMPAEKLREWVEANVGVLLTETYGRIFSCRERQNTRDVGPTVQKLLTRMLDVLCMLNKRWANVNYLGLTDAFSFPKLPEGYTAIVPKITSSHDIEEIASLAETLVLNFWRLLDDEGIRRPTVYQTLNDLPI
jgi:hypothetical protein